MHSTFGYRSKLDKYENVDEDKLLASLTAEELQELERELADMEPDDAVPIGLRQQDQIASTSTGSFSTDKLLNYWDNDGHRLLEHKVTFFNVILCPIVISALFSTLTC